MKTEYNYDTRVLAAVAERVEETIEDAVRLMWSVDDWDRYREVAKENGDMMQIAVLNIAQLTMED